MSEELLSNRAGMNTHSTRGGGLSARRLDLLGLAWRRVQICQRSEASQGSKQLLALRGTVFTWRALAALKSGPKVFKVAVFDILREIRAGR